MSKQLKIDEIESYFDIDLCLNYTSIGFDVALHKTGIAILRTTEDSLIIDLLDTFDVPKNLDELDAYDLFLSQLDDFKTKMSRKYKFDEAVIENCWLGMNPKTLVQLARCGGYIYDRFKSISKHIDFVMPKEARANINFKKSNKSIKGYKLKKEIMKYINEGLNLELKDDNLADGLALALGGLRYE
jgi:Holliday junction resolvasome RuvABC endonuclease subunit